MSKTTELLFGIKEETAVINQKVESLNKNFEDHKYGDSKRREKQAAWEDRMEEAVKECPETGHIKEQNGKIGDMQLTLKAIKLLVKWILVVGTLAGIYFGIVQNAHGDMINTSYTYDTLEKQEEVMTEALNRFTNSGLATMYGITFACPDSESSRPILNVNMNHFCLKCDQCLAFMNSIGSELAKVNDEWFRRFGTHRMDIYNKKHKLIFMIDKDNKVISTDRRLDGTFSI